jgi:beta-glucuronidase
MILRRITVAGSLLVVAGALVPSAATGGEEAGSSSAGRGWAWPPSAQREAGWLALEDPASSPSDHEPARTTVRTVDGTNIVTQYGAVVPSFDGWRTHEATRGYLDLDGSWRFRFDPDAVGLDRGWQRRDFDDSGWDRIAVPSAWDLKDQPGWGSYDGTGFGHGTAFTDGYSWYRTGVDVPPAWGHRYVRLNFLAANYAADVWVNGMFVGRHEGGHGPFALPVGDALRPGPANVIAVRVYRRADFQDYETGTGQITDDKAIPWKPVDYWPYAGITRSVWLESVPRVTIAKVLVDAGAGRFDARVVIENHGGKPFHGTALVDPGDNTGADPVIVPVDVGAGDVSVATALTAIPDAPRWSPADPNVLTATASLRSGSASRIDQLTTSYGARTVAVDGSRLLVNAHPVFLKGVNWHEETAANGSAMTIADYDRELGHVLDANANLIRNTVYTRHPYVYDWADRHGVFVMDDTDNMWVNTAQERLQTEQYGLSRAMALTMAWNQHNSPATILWCLQNESEIDANGAPVYRAWLADMKQAVKDVDLSDRPVTWASSTTNDPAFDLADVIGFNEYFGYFYGKNEDLGPAIDGVHARYPNKPIVITENGSWSIPGTHGPADQAGTEEWQAANFRSHWAQTTARSDYVAGYVFWLLKDYKQRLGYNEEYNGISVMGMLGFDSSTKKLVYDAFRNAQTRPHIQ